MDEERGLLAALEAAPEDDGNWLVYADWLEEHGDPRAEFLRLTAELGRGAVPTERVVATAERLRELRALLVPPDWVRRCDLLQAMRPLRFRVTFPPSSMQGLWSGPESLVVVRGVLESGTLRAWSGVAVPVEEGLAHDWLREVWVEDASLTSLSAGQGPNIEIGLLLSSLCLAAGVGETIRPSPQADAELQAKLDLSLAELELSVRATNCLEWAGILTARQLVTSGDLDLLEIRNFGETTLKEVKTKLWEHRLQLGMPAIPPLGP